MEVIASFSKGYAPLYHWAKITYMQKRIEKIDKVYLERYIKEWGKIGCSFIHDG